MGTDLGRNAVAIANGEMGVTEHPPGSNSGPRVNEYLAAVQLGPGYAWCSAFASWCIQRAAVALGIAPAFRYSGGALALWSRNAPRSIAPQALTPDDLPCVVVWNHGGGLGHVGLCVGLDQAAGKLQTIEGNSDANGSRTGGQVVAHSDRRLDDPKLMGFLRIE